MKISTFYRSDKWRNLLANLKLERVNEKGQLICEHCGLPIVKSYDCIGHHKVALTPDNVDDVNISLNPDNIALIHFKCHNLIHERFNGVRPQSDKPFTGGMTQRKVYLVYGSPCSGKSSFVKENANSDDLVLDMDRLWDAISLGGRYDGKARRSNRLKPCVFGLRDCMIDMIRIRKGMWRNAWVIGGYPLRTERDRICDLLNAEPVFIDTPKDECLSRADRERPEEWKGYIENWFASFVS